MRSANMLLKWLRWRRSSGFRITTATSKRRGMGTMGGVGRGRPEMNQAPGPARVTNRGQHKFTCMRGGEDIFASCLYLGGFLHHRALFFCLLLLLSYYLHRVS